MEKRKEKDYKAELQQLEKENEELRKELELAELRAEKAELMRKLMAKQFPYNPYYNWTITLLNDTDSNIVLC